MQGVHLKYQAYEVTGHRFIFETEVLTTLRQALIYIYIHIYILIQAYR